MTNNLTRDITAQPIHLHGQLEKCRACYGNPLQNQTACHMIWYARLVLNSCAGRSSFCILLVFQTALQVNGTLYRFVDHVPYSSSLTYASKGRFVLCK